MGKDLSQAIGVDLGGTKIAIALVNEQGKILRQVRLKTDVAGGPQAIELQICNVVQDIIKSEKVSGIGIGVAGQIDEKNGSVIFSPNLNWHDHPLQENLHQMTQLPVKVVNDMRAITTAEWNYGTGQGCDDFVCVYFGTGVGGGVVSQGRLMKGCSNTCGEIGHLTIHFQGRLCTCGNRGCFEAYAGGWAIAQQAGITAKQVVEAYHHGDSQANLLIQDFKQAAVAGCVSIVNAFNPCRLILGGGVLSGLPEMIPFLDTSVRQFALKAASAKLQILPSILKKDEVGVLGAAAIIVKGDL